MSSGCPHCFAGEIETVLSGSSRSLQCKRCGGRFNEPPGSTDSLYDADYFERNYNPRRELQMLQARDDARLLRQYGAGEPILDYGCGAGVFPETLLAEGYRDIYCADVSRDALDIVERRLGDRVKTVDLHRGSLPDMRFETICLMDSISHIPRAEAVLGELVSEHLVEGGVLLIRTPDVKDSYFRLAQLFRPLIGTRRFTKLTFANARYVLFNRTNIRWLLERLRCEIVFETETQELLPHPTSLSPVHLARHLFLRAMQTQLPTMRILTRKQEEH
ncbi:MAG: class I SAM-dependent methyltransferase [Gemmatimonadetes bacterium]|nr:class I SAM-dependent methyltransferase [Gemmatimonadota bacterium]